MVHGYWIWTFLNLIILIGYLFFLQKNLPGNGTTVNYLNLLILMLISYPVLSNIITGQVEVFLVVFAGEFIRNAVSKKPILSGIWLGGLLLKPQLLILIIPIFLIMRNWKVLFGFIVSSGIILMTSLFLSGFAGMKALINLWTKYSVGMASNFLEGMINWRMVGVNVNTLMNTSLGWVITGLGMVLTIVAVYFLIKKRPPFGSPPWIMAMLGVFSATLAITWHSHYHMAMVLIPFLIYASLYKLLPEKIIFLWGIVTPVALFCMLIIDVLVLVLTKINITNYNGMVIAFSGFILNLVIFISAMQFTNNRNLKQY
ncbi:MAG: glycosyltransferase 87 family protein [Anaerolineaceae bacterium]|nr:glycosyltransferase 87 family protein [Anaerolineaceae bacterium]